MKIYKSNCKIRIVYIMWFEPTDRSRILSLNRSSEIKNVTNKGEVYNVE